MKSRTILHIPTGLVLLSLALAACGGPSSPAPATEVAAVTPAPTTQVVAASPSPGGAETEALQITFTAEPQQIAPGKCATLRWEVTGPHFVVMLDDEQVADQGSKEVCPPETQIYFLRVDTGETMEERQVTVQVGAGAPPAEGEPGETPAPSTTEAPATGNGTPSPAETEASAEPSSGSGTYRYDFEQDASGWDLGSAWTRAALDDGGYALFGRGSGGAVLTGVSGPISYVKYRFFTGPLAGAFTTNIMTAQRRYSLEIGPRGLCYFELSPEEGGQEQCNYGHYPILPQRFYTVEFYISDTSLDIFIDGQGVVGTDLSTPLDNERTLSFETSGSVTDGNAVPDTKIQAIIVDDVEVQIGGGKQAPSKARSPYSWQPGADVGPFTNGKMKQSLTLDGSQSLTLSGGRYTAYGDITLKGNASLTVEANTALYISDIYLYDNATLTMKGGYLLATGAVAGAEDQASISDMLGAIYAAGQSKVDISHTDIQIHFIDVLGNSSLSLKDCKFFTPGGGMITPYGAGNIYVENTTLGAITLPIPDKAVFKATGLKPGHFDNLNLAQDMDISGVGYNIVLKNVDIVKDTLPTGYASDASERGWELEVHEGAQVELTDSELRKLTFQIQGSGSPLTFQNLVVGTPMNATVGPAVLKNTSVRGQWGFYVHGNRQVTITDSDGVWPLPYDTSQVTIKNTRINEFDPRQYTGTIIFDNVRWYGPGEIIMDCDFLMLGSIEMQVPSLAWLDSTVTREYLIQVRDASGNSVSGVTLTIQGSDGTQTVTTDAQGEARVRLKFTAVDQSWTLTSDRGDSQTITFYTTTPIVLSP